jgi:hypothetical protein
MSAIPITTKGGDLPFQFDLDGLPLDGFICTITVKKRPELEDEITPRVIEPTDDLWTGFLTTTEIASLSVGRHELIALIENTNTLEGQQRPKRFFVIDSFSTTDPISWDSLVGNWDSLVGNWDSL